MAELVAVARIVDGKDGYTVVVSAGRSGTPHHLLEQRTARTLADARNVRAGLVAILRETAKRQGDELGDVWEVDP